MGKTFNDEATSDLLLICSSDSIRFYAHKGVLASQSNVFADAESLSAYTGVYSRFSSDGGDATTGAENLDSGKEEVFVTERPQILEALLRYIYRDDAFPNPQDMEKDDFFQLAEAAEKYDVWTLKQLLLNCMRLKGVTLYPLETFDFAIRHGYKQLGLDAAMQAVQQSATLTSAEPTLSGLALEKWLSLRKTLVTITPFYKELGSAPPDVINFGRYHVYPSSSPSLIGGSYYKSVCNQWNEFDKDIQGISEFVASRSAIPSMDVSLAFKDGIRLKLDKCPICRERAERWLGQYMDSRKDKLMEALFGAESKETIASPASS